ncbi:MAG: glycine/sarcosine/betaine reductase complex component C subunit beta [Dehalococcoidia bacterium]|jgi:betaine reductase|nr:glycine/sarcosine/betaine reductase complex component C subunit beta [Dehalococcoidia bacterium]
MSTGRVKISGARNFLAHTPGLVRYGSKPTRDIEANASAEDEIIAGLRSYERAAAYLPNVVYLGGIQPDEMWDIERPWFNNDGPHVRRHPYGEMMPEDEFLGVMKTSDDFDILWLEESFNDEVRQKLAAHPYWAEEELERLEKGVPLDLIEGQMGPSSDNLPLFLRGGRLVGVVNRAHDLDASLFADVLLENLATKAAAVMATKTLLGDLDIEAESIPYILNSGEEAVGDRYQRGGGNLAKAIGELSGCTMATGSDVKAFCTGPNHAIAIGASLVYSGLFERVLVVGGCSFAKLGMKYQGHLSAEMPIVEDVLAGSAILIEKRDGEGAVIRLDSIGVHPVGAGSAQAKIMEGLVSKPLARLGLTFGDVDKYATEMHNPEVTEPSGSGNVPQLNYNLIAALAVRSGQIERSEMTDFARKIGMPGFSPTQGHIASAIPFLPHALDGITRGDMKRVMFLAKGSLFLGRMTQLSDGLSFIIEGDG